MKNLAGFNDSKLENMKEEFENELRQLSPFLADLKKRQADDPFKTPTLYFDNLADAVELREASAVLADLKKQQVREPFKTPALYFENLANAVELRELSPILANLKQNQAKTNPFKTPKFYFSTLADKVLAAASQPSTSEIGQQRTPQYPSILERAKGFSATIFAPKLALAFASCALVAVAGWYAWTRQNDAAIVLPSFETTVVKSPNVEKMPTNGENLPTTNATQTSVNQPVIALSDIPKTEIQNYINDNLIDFDEAVFIEHAPQLAEIQTTKAAAAAQPLTHPKSGLTEEELELYLKENLEEEDSDGSNNKF